MADVQSSKYSLVGKTVADRYEVVSLIGHGAMGAVYKAKHTVIGRFFAVKTLTAKGHDDVRVLRRFRAEAQAMSVLTHPNLIQISDYGNADDGTPFLVMEYLEGISLGDYIHKNGPLTVEFALPLFAQIADALAHAHGKNLIHRDLKPSNIMLIGDKHDFVKVVDLGIAKAIEAADDLHLTQTGEVFGSPLYMSPEQVQGNQLDHRSDIYSFGCLMYECFSAIPPLKGANFVQTAYKHMNEMPRPLREIRPDISQDVADVITACLAKKPEERIESMTTLREVFRELASVHCPDSQASTLASQTVQSTLRNTRSSAVGTIPSVTTGGGNVPWRIVAVAVSVVAIIFGVLVAGMSLNRTPAPVPAAGSAAQTVVPDDPNTKIDLTNRSSVSVESPLFARDNPNAPEEIDVVAVYAAQPPVNDSKGKAIIEAEDVTVGVHATKQPITLVLFSYLPVHWNVKPYTGATIKKVLASGFHPQKVIGAGCSDVTSVCTEHHDKDAFHTANIFTTNPNTVDANRNAVYDQIQQGVHQLLGPNAQIRHFAGRYYGTNFEIPKPSS